MTHVDDERGPSHDASVRARSTLNSVRRHLFEPARLAALHPVALVEGLRRRHDFRDLRGFVLFVGASRSGHSVVGSVLDAHPNVVMAHEMGVLKYVRARYTRPQLCSLVRQSSVAFSAAGRRSKGFDYRVPNQWQGRSSQILLMGDKMAEGATRRLRDKPELLGRLQATVRAPVKLMHVVRNPFDNIATISLRTRKRRLASSLSRSAEFYFTLCETVETLRNRTDAHDFFELRHETLIDTPSECLAQLCAFLGLEVSPDYLEDCSGVIYGAPHKSRHEVAWTPELIDRVSRRMERFSFLRGYSFGV